MADGTMTGQAFFVLTALADGPRHGYGIVGEVAELSQGRVRLKIGSLYGVLDRLAGAGLTMVLLAAVAAAYRIASLGDYLQGHYLQDPHLITVGLAELVILVAAVALVAPNAGRAQTAMPAPPPHLQPG